VREGGTRRPGDALGNRRLQRWLCVAGVAAVASAVPALAAHNQPAEVASFIAASCDAKAANDLDAFIAGRPVNCLPISLDRYGRTVATCSVGGADLGDWLVRNGLALDWPQYSKRKYESAQGDAEQAGRGMWAGTYVEPWLFRVCVRASGSPSNCSDDANAHP